MGVSANADYLMQMNRGINMLKCQYCVKSIHNKRNAFIADNIPFCSGDCRTWYDYRLEKLEDLVRNCRVTQKRLANKIENKKATALNTKNRTKNIDKYRQNEEELLYYTSRMDKLTRNKNNADDLSFIFANKRASD